VQEAEVKSIGSLIVNPKSALIISVLVTILCMLGYIAGTTYADSDNRINSGAAGSGQWLTVRMRVTAYCPCPKCCEKYSDGVTASGHKIRKGDFFVAADRKYPFGTEMIIPGYNNGEVVKVLDRGGAIDGDQLDVFFGSHQEALEWGVRNIDVKIRNE